MKKMIAWAMALLLLGGAGMAAADVPRMQVNPQQKGHVAYLESQHSKSAAQRILKSYGRSNLDTPQESGSAPQETTNESLVTVWRPGEYGYETPENVWSDLQPGDYFATGGKRYYVARITTVANAPVLVAFLVTEGGQVIDTTPRYFYL